MGAHADLRVTSAHGHQLACPLTVRYDADPTLRRRLRTTFTSNLRSALLPTFAMRARQSSLADQ